MDHTHESVMMSGYLEATVRSWGDAEFKRRLAERPRDALAESGWEIPARVEVEARFCGPAELADHTPPTAAELTDLWSRGIEGGELRLVFADGDPRAIETAELSEDDLAQVGGGHFIFALLPSGS